MSSPNKASYEEAIAAYRKAIELKPDLPKAHYNLGNALRKQGKLEGAIPAYRKAIELKSDYAEAHTNLGLALAGKRRWDEAIAEYKEALSRQPDFPGAYLAHFNLGLALQAKGLPDEAIAAYRKAIELKSDYAEAHTNLGNILVSQGKLDEAVTAFRQAIDRKPDLATVHFNLGFALSKQDRLDEAIAAYRRAAELKPMDSNPPYNLGGALHNQRKLGEAIAAYRKSLALNPNGAKAHLNLGLALRDQGEFAQALLHLKRGYELGSRDRHWPYESAEWVKDCERLIEAAARLPRVLAGELAVVDARERVALAEVCFRKRRFELAIRFYEEALAQEPALAEDLKSGHRYNAACTAALASTGEGKDATSLGDEQRTRRRRQALDWLHADLQQHARALENSGQDARVETAKTLQRWLRDPDLKGLREPNHLATLPVEEREASMKLWNDVRELLSRAQNK
jgi:tetratricopeptide (TPR) repeat protein